MGLFRSSNDEFLLCYDSKNGPQIRPQPVRSSSLLQNSGCISTSMATSIPQRARLNGRLLRIMSHATHHTCSSSMRATSRYDILRAGGCARSSMVRAYDALGMDTDHRYHYSGLTQMEWKEKHLCQGLPCAVSCAPTTVHRGLVHLILRALQYSVSLSSCRRSSTHFPSR
jgi:hypothetical protein